MGDEEAVALPAGWVSVRLEDLVLNPKSDLVDGPFGSNLKSSEYVDSGVPVLKIQNIKANRFVRKRLSYVTTEKAAQLDRHSFVAGDLMITKLGEPLGLCCKVPDDLAHGVFVADLMRLRPSPMIVDSAFLLHAINSVVVQNQFKEITKGTTRQRVNLTIVRDIQISLPPLAEQHRIVAKIEELFSELDQGVASLKTAREQLKVYRQSLLKNAFEGKLTAAWRAAHRDQLETAAALQQRIARERRARYQQQLADWQTAGQAGPKPKPHKPLPPLTAEELAELPELPAGWAYSYLADMGDLGRGKSKHRPRNDPRLFGGSFPFIQTGEVKAANRVIRSHSQTYSDFGLAQSKLWPKGTLCITIAANIAETAFLGFEGCFPDSVVGFTAFEPVVRAEYIDYFIQAARTRIEAYAPATAQKNINLETLENLVVPYCSHAEQEAVLCELESKLSEADQLDQTLATALQQADALRQSILKKAFSGQLVKQDKNEEPATALLERIRAGKSNGMKIPRNRRKSG